jgi:glycosyltransferase involved in cell wall biosynthesis
VRRKVFHFTDSTGFGGAEQALLLLLAGLDPDRWDVTLAYPAATGAEPLAARAHALGAATWPIPPMPLGWEGARHVPRFARKLGVCRPDVFHAHLTWPLGCKFGLAAAVLARVPAIVATQHLFFDVALTRTSVLQLRLLARGIDRYLAVSRHTAEQLRRTLRVPSAKLEVVPNAVEATAHAGAADRLTDRGNRPTVLAAARLHEQKGLRYLLDAVPHVPGARFVLAGEGPERESLEAQSEGQGISSRVSFLGARSDVPALLEGCDIFVLPSLYEGLPLSVLEAMAAGKPVVATRIGGTDEAVVDGETGFLVPPRDSRALAAALTTLLADPARARAMGEAGRARVRRRFSSERMVADVTCVYEEILEARDARRGR